MHAGVGNAYDLDYRNTEEINKAIKNDDLNNLQKQLSEKKVEEIKNLVFKKIDNAVNFAETSEFPYSKELYDNVYG